MAKTKETEMGESRNLFTIPAYLKVGNKRLKVLKWGTPGLIVENSPLLEGKEEIVADFIFPYDAYNELIIPDIKLKCQTEDGKLFCRFGELSDEQQDALKFIIREYLWRRIISIPSKFMNYTQDNVVRRELLALQRNLSLKKKLKKVLYATIVVVGIGTTFLGAKLLTEKEPSGLTVKYSEESKSQIKEEVKKEKLTFKNREQSLKSREGLLNTQKKESIGSTKIALSDNPDNSREKQKANATGEEQTPAAKAPSEVKTTSEVIQGQQTAETETSTKKEEKLSRTEDYYCVQVATDTSAERLIKLAEKLKDFPYVRVEKIGRYYTLRVGFDRTYQEDKKLAQEISKKLHKRVFPRVCAYRPERWVYPQAEAR